MFTRRSTLRSPQFARKKKKQLWFRVGAISVICIAVIAVPALFSHLGAVTISNIEVKGSETTEHDALLRYVEEKISGNYLGIFSRKNIFLYPREEIEKGLLGDFPEVEHVQVSFKDFSSILVEVGERSPTAVWCSGDDDSSQTLHTDCYLIDEEGLIFAQAPHFSGNVFMRFYGLVDPAKPIGSYYLSAREYQDAKHFSKRLADLGVDTAGIFLGGEEGEVTTTSGGKILFSRKQPFDSTIDQLDLLLKDRTTVPARDEFLRDVEYIDARISNKIFFKNRGSVENRPQ